VSAAEQWEKIRPYIGASLIVSFTSLAVWIFGEVATNGRPEWTLAFAGFCGAAVAAAEISNRYKDEPLQAVLSPFGIIYCVANFALSAAALLLIIRYPRIMGQLATDNLAASLAAGFGAIVVMRSKVAVLKGPDNKDIAIGPDAVITALLRVADSQIDRHRARRRQSLVVKHVGRIRDLGDPPEAYKYLSASLLSLQNLEADLKLALNNTWSSYERENLPKEVKHLALGFLFLTLVGESNFEAILIDAAKVKATAP
jgi:hypothetical protein